jgi:hypothetical protein
MGGGGGLRLISDGEGGGEFEIRESIKEDMMGGGRFWVAFWLGSVANTVREGWMELHSRYETHHEIQERGRTGSR